MSIIIIDYGMGNLRSVQKKLIDIGVEGRITSNLREISEGEKLILPGVGHFANGVKKLKEYGIWDVINEKVLIKKTPVLGICLGMQLMGDHSEEGNVKGLGWIDAKVIKFKIQNKIRHKIPHIGWNSIVLKKESELFKNIPNDAMFYFIHSYHMKCNIENDVIASTEYEYSFTSAIQKENIFGTQFHPEKSHDLGKQVFKNFIDL